MAKSNGLALAAGILVAAIAASGPAPAQPRASDDAPAHAVAPVIVQPARGSVVTQGHVRVRATLPPGAQRTQIAEIEVAWLPPLVATTMLLQSQMPVKTLRVPLARLDEGVLLPADMTDRWTGPARVRVRASGADAPWSDEVDFDLVSLAERHARFPEAVTARDALPLR